MTELEIKYLKNNIDKAVEIETTDGERLIAKVLFVTDNEEYGEHDLLYEVVSSNMLDSYAHLENAGGYVLDFDKILAVRPLFDLSTQMPKASGLEGKSE
ncbi:MAG: hypothetical protein KGJ51_11050 [Acidobacteriota bacterium]|nr:hypothetical protein [Acidobacteriota bacterium]MDE3161743.1 hypothetical protein [Acidobacteriota bacterium]